MKIKARATRHKNSEGEFINHEEPILIEFDYSLGENLKEAVILFGEETVYGKFVQSAVVELQNIVRSAVENNDTVETAIAAAVAYKIGDKRGRTVEPPQVIADRYLRSLTKEQRKTLMAGIE